MGSGQVLADPFLAFVSRVLWQGKQPDVKTATFGVYWALDHAIKFAPGGIGAIRKVGLWPLLLREETVEYEQDHRHVYQFAGPPAPAKDYRAEVVFTPNAAGGTDIRWRGSFVEGLPGTGGVTLAVLRTAIQIISGQLIKAAERK